MTDSNLNPIMPTCGREMQRGRRELLYGIHVSSGLADSFRRSSREAVAMGDTDAAIAFALASAKHRADADKLARAAGVHVSVGVRYAEGR